MNPIVSGAISIVLWVIILKLQAGRHHQSSFAEEGAAAEDVAKPAKARGSILFHTTLLFAHMVRLVFLVETLATPLDYVIETVQAPAALGGVIVLCSSPPRGNQRCSRGHRKPFAARVKRLAWVSVVDHRHYRPAILFFGHLTGHPVILGLTGSDPVMLPVSLTVSIITFAGGRTHVMQDQSPQGLCLSSTPSSRGICVRSA